MKSESNPSVMLAIVLASCFGAVVGIGLCVLALAAWTFLR